MKQRKAWSPYMTKRLKSTKVNGVRIYLQAYQTKPMNREGELQNVTVFYYIVKASDGSYRKIMQYEEALFQISATYRVRETPNKHRRRCKMTREEEIKQAAGLEFEHPFVQIANEGFVSGAKWADEHPQNPWRDAKKDPPKDTKPVIGYDADGIVGQYEYSPEERIWSLGILLSDAPKYWMPIPELPKGGEK